MTPLSKLEQEIQGAEEFLVSLLLQPSIGTEKVHFSREPRFLWTLPNVLGETLSRPMFEAGQGWRTS